MDEEAHKLLGECEKGYDPREVLIETDNKELIIAQTFISISISDNPPDKNYIQKIIDGAKEMDLPEEYRSFLINYAKTLSTIHRT